MQWLMYTRIQLCKYSVDNISSLSLNFLPLLMLSRKSFNLLKRRELHLWKKISILSQKVSVATDVLIKRKFHAKLYVL